MLQMKALQGYISPRFEWICPKCDAIHFVDVLDFFKATAGGSGMKCDVCRIAYEVKIELLDPRSPTLRAPVQSEQKCPSCSGTGTYIGKIGSGHKCVACDGTGISTRSDGG